MPSRLRMTFAAFLVSMIGTTILAEPSHAYERNGIYASGGNHFIVRVQRQGATVYLRAYRQAGDQWERYGTAAIPAARFEHRRSVVMRGGGSMIERIYFGGRLVGYSDLDLDNPLYTDLNRNGEGCISCN